MPLSPAQYQTLLLAEVGDDGTVGAIIQLLWTKHDDKPAVLQYVYVKIDAIKALMGRLRGAFNVAEDGQRLDLHQKFDNLVAMLQSTQEELALAIASAPGNEPAVGQMEANFPLETPDGWFADPNDTFYTGDPIALQRRQFRGRP
jgi:hypothetical protein